MWRRDEVEGLYYYHKNANDGGGEVQISKGAPQDSLAAVLPGAHQAVWCLHASGGRICVVR